jgi:hypothetical protein
VESKICNAENNSQNGVIDKRLMKIIVIITACVFVVAFILSSLDPIVLTIRNEDVDKSDTVIHSFYADERSRYYLADGSFSLQVRVYYLNRGWETIDEAFRKGHIDLYDLDRFGIEYIIKPIE